MILSSTTVKPEFHQHFGQACGVGFNGTNILNKCMCAFAFLFFIGHVRLQRTVQNKT